MKQNSEIEKKYDYERAMEEVGRKALKKSKRRFAFLGILLLAVGIGTMIARFIVVGIIFLVLAVLCFAGAISRASKMKDAVYVRKVGLEKSKKAGNAPENGQEGTASAADAGANSTAGAARKSLSSQMAPPSDADVRPREDGKDPDVWGPIKGF